MFRVYKPKGLFRIKAVQVTTDNIQEIATVHMGRVVVRNDEAVGVDIPTLEGTKHFALSDWIVKTEDNRLDLVPAEEFDNTYELAVNRVNNAG